MITSRIVPLDWMALLGSHTEAGYGVEAEETGPGKRPLGSGKKVVLGCSYYGEDAEGGSVM